MVSRILLIFLLVCLAFIYSINSFNNTSKLDFADVASLIVLQPDGKELRFDGNDPQDNAAMAKLVDWYDKKRFLSLSITTQFPDFNVFSWELKDGRKLLMYAPAQFQGYIMVKDYRLPWAYKFSVEPSSDLQWFKMLQSSDQ